MAVRRMRVSFLATLLALGIGAGKTGSGAGTSEWVHIGPDGKLAYKTTPAGDHIMDFSYAGYMGGGVALPTVPVVKTIKPSGGADDTSTIQSAIDEVAAMPLKDGFRGTVLLSTGTFPCSQTILITASGVVLRGSGDGANDSNVSTIKLIGQPHLAISVQPTKTRRPLALDPPSGEQVNPNSAGDLAQTTITDAYVPSGTTTFHVADASKFAAGDEVIIERPVTEAWVKFMHMDDMVRDGNDQTWLKVGSHTTTERTVAAVNGKTITLDIPLTDSFDAKYLNPPGVKVFKIKPPVRISQSAVEDLHIECPPQAINHTQAHFQALRMNGQDLWARDLIIDETMNSVAVSGRRITLQRVVVNRKAKHQGSSKPAEFAPNASQVLLDRCGVTGDNIWFSATGGGQAGPIVLLNCTFHGDGVAESHQRWSTGLLYDNCRAPEGGIDMRNRGSMGSGHGWTMGWGVVWNCSAKEFTVQNPPGATNWLIGSIGKDARAPRPFGKEPDMPEGTVDSDGTPVTPRSLYLTQLAQRLGPNALKNLGYQSAADLKSDD
jgi:hypothetical protein